MTIIPPHVLQAIKNTCANKKPGWQAGLVSRSLRLSVEQNQTNIERMHYGEKPHQE